MTRTGIGYDSHRIVAGGRMLLGGIEVSGDLHLAGHSDGDAIAHALTDALLGAAAAGDIGALFPDTDPANKGRDSIEMLKAALSEIATMGYSVINVDVTVIAERPKIGPFRDRIRESLANALGITAGRVSVKGKTNEGMGWIGSGEGLACIAVATIYSDSDVGED